jgi:7,8-dihydropterin-6-yl-methyl-4-(beta-D-ribofuranosyl)aminobenzene 5'-phosphate synthase
MRIVTLVDNDTTRKELKAAHGLSLYIETAKHKVLFDLGPNNLYLKNAKLLGIAIEDIDIVVISHGHNDHATGLKAFFKRNNKAKVYVSRYFFDEHVKVKGNAHINIGVKRHKKFAHRFLYVDKYTKIDEELSIFVDVPYQEQVIQDHALKVYDGDRYLDEDFRHEIYFVIHEDENICLFSGCSHKGIEHIIDTIESNEQFTFTHVIGGYHFSHYDPFNFKETDYLTHLGQKFYDRPDSRFYSCHCTGEDAYKQLKTHMREKLFQLRTGDVIII